MKITLCGSIAFYKEMTEVTKALEILGHGVRLPVIGSESEDKKEQVMRAHFDKIE